MDSKQILKGYPALSEKYGPHLTNWLVVEHEGWRLVGSGIPYVDCGEWRYRGCLNVLAHNINRLDGVQVQNRVYVQRYKRNCVRAQCSICYEGWVGREAKRANNRFSAFTTKSKAIHVIISPKEYINFDQMKAKARKLLKRAGIYGGMMIFHPFRQDKEGIWYFSPHFHVLGYGWTKSSKEIFEETGWVIKNLGVRKSIKHTIFYQLSHSGTHHAYHGVTWFGALSYNRLSVKESEEPEHLCPICASKCLPITPALSQHTHNFQAFWATNEALFPPDLWKPLRNSY